MKVSDPYPAACCLSALLQSSQLQRQEPGGCQQQQSCTERLAASQPCCTARSSAAGALKHVGPVQAGLSALKTPHSYSMAASRDDPLSSQVRPLCASDCCLVLPACKRRPDTCMLQAYQTLAEQLPFAKHVHSKLLCHVTKELMDDDNVPMVMPNGTVYSQRAVRRLSSDSGMFTCPKSGDAGCWLLLLGAKLARPDRIAAAGVCCDVGALQRAYIL